MPEKQTHTKEILRVVSNIAIGGALLQLAGTAFSKKSRYEIAERAMFESEISGRGDRPLEASHIDHTKGSDFYNDPRNGILMTDEEHLIYHEDFVGNAYAIGLSERDNDHSVRSLYGRVERFNKRNRLPNISLREKGLLSKDIERKVREVCTRAEVQCPYDII